MTCSILSEAFLYARNPRHSFISFEWTSSLGFGSASIDPSTIAAGAHAGLKE